MDLRRIKIADLVPASYNPRKTLKPSDKEYEKIKRSIQEFGYCEPVIVNSDITIIGGHQRVTVLQDLGYGKHQPEENATCLRCGYEMPGLTRMQALSRNARIMVRSQCGMKEALEAAELRKKTSLMDWVAIRQTQTGGRAWKG